MSYKIGTVQPPDIQGDVPQALSIISSFMTLADQQGIDLLCFPECFLQGYTLDTKTTEERAIDLSSKAFSDILVRFKPHNVAMILGLIEKDGLHFFNTAVVIKQGKLIGKYRKVNLFEKNFKPGTEHTVFEIAGLKFGVNICYDARFAEGANEMASKGASIIFYPLSNRWPIQKAKKYRYKHIPNLVDRAVESGCWVVSSDITYRDDETMGYGCAAIVSPDGDVVKRVADFEMGMTSFTIRQGADRIGVSAGAMIFNDRGELFLSKRSQNCKNERGHWETPGGSVEFGETLEQATKREILEEYGAEIEIIEQFPAADHLIPAEGQHWVATTFLARFKPGQAPKITEPDKCDEVGWFPLDKLPQPLSIITEMDLKEYAKRRGVSGQNE